MKVGELCAGYGGISMGLKLAGEDVDLRWLAESDPALDVLHPLGVPNLGDITTVDWSTVEPVDLLTAGFPCQPFSAAGAQLAQADHRYLWPAVRDAIVALLPPRVLLENVRNLISIRKGEIWAHILDDLTALGYDVTWLTLGACAIGGAHHRHRVFALATHTQWSEPRVTRLDVQECGARRGSSIDVLPTPSTSNAHGNHVNNRGEMLLPGVAVALLPTPSASENTGAGHAAQGGINLRTAVTTPFDRFQAAVDRHAAVFGPPPAPTEPNRNGAPRLSAAFAEWLMCIPAGHVTDALPRSAALKAIGNGVCPPQLAQAWRHLTGVDKPSDMSIGFGAMTTSTSADVKEIQDRNAAARGRVIAVAEKALREAFADDGLRGTAAETIEAAMMELAAVWREEAAHVTAAGRKGHIGIAKEYTMAAARLAGFAVGLTTRPVIAPPLDDLAAVATDLESLDIHPAQCDCGRPECAALYLGSNPWGPAVEDVVDALPEGDPVAEILGGAMIAEDPERVMAFMRGETDDPGVVYAKRGGIQFPAAPLADLAGAFVGGQADAFDITTSEENALRYIIGPLGASGVTATIDHPFTNPGIPWLNQRRSVEVIPYAELPIIAAATPPRGHVSHSYVETYEGCSLSAMLRDASRAGHVGASRPGWSQLGGQAFHRAVELIERLALSGVTTADDPEALWNQHFDAVIKEQLDALVGTPYADSATWYISNRGKEGFDWWRVEGAKMLGLYVKHHTSTWRANNPTFLLQDTTPVIELEYSMSIRSLDGERGLTAQGFVDRATLDLTTYSLTVLDYKTGAREPESTFQLGEYGHALLMAMGIAAEPAGRPILGRYWLARKGIYTDAVPVVTRHPLAELQYRYDAAARGTAARIFAPHVTNLCKSCSMVDYCPAQAGRS